VVELARVAKPEFASVFRWCFVFAMRISEALRLQKGMPVHARKRLLPEGRLSSVSLHNKEVTVILDSRKNAQAGDSVQRPCICGAGMLWRKMCPIHDLHASITMFKDGDCLFPGIPGDEKARYNATLKELKRCCGVLLLDLPAPPGTHSFRRSAIQLMEAAGAENFSKLGLLGLGSHNSRAVNEYRDKRAAEERIFRTAVLAHAVELAPGEELH
jgi:integrase